MKTTTPDGLYVVYHNRDLDGFTSGAILKKRFLDAVLIGHDYSDDHQKLIDRLPEGAVVIMVDVSLPMHLMITLAVKCKLTWIDHHISAINDFRANNVVTVETLLDTNAAACELAWRYCYPTIDTPPAVRLLGEYDTWRNQDPVRWAKVLAFQFGMRVRCTSPETFPSEFLEPSEPTDAIAIGMVVNEGETVLAYQAQVNKLQCQRGAFEYNFMGFRAICLNGAGFNSDVFKTVWDPAKHDVMMPFAWNGKNWTVSLYTTKDDIDCSLIAKERGGGGHKKAAGFTVDLLHYVFPDLHPKWMSDPAGWMTSWLKAYDKAHETNLATELPAWMSTQPVTSG